MDESDKLFLAGMTNDFLLAFRVMAKIIGDLFLSADAISIYIVFALGFLALWLKGKLESN